MDLLTIIWKSEGYKYPVVTTFNENDRTGIEKSTVLSIFSARVASASSISDLCIAYMFPVFLKFVYVPDSIIYYCNHQ